MSTTTGGAREPAVALDSNEDFDDISLTFWVALWTVLAVVATLIYVRLKGISTNEGSSLPRSKRVEEQIARKLVNEISRKESLVKRSTFRRQRSYEIIDGEVRIHYDIPFEESDTQQLSDNGQLGKDDILSSREVESFPSVSTEAMDEMELLFPRNLPLIIEEGEESYEDDIIVKAVQVEVEEESCPQNQAEIISAIEVLTALNIAEHESIDKDIVTTERKMVNEDVNSSREIDSFVAQPAGQTIATEITSLEREMDSSCCPDTEVHLLSNRDKLSSDELSSTSEESALETTNNVQILRPDCASDNQIMSAEHTSHSATQSVYRLRELEHDTATHDYTVTRRIYTKTTTSENTSATQSVVPFGKVLSCDQNQDSDICENTTTRQDSISQDNGVATNNCQPSINIKDTVVRYVTGHQSVKGTIETECTNIEKERTLSAEEICEEDADFEDSVLQEPDVIVGEGDIPDTNFELPEEVDGDVTLTQLQEGGDLLVDDSGDILFKVIGPSSDGLLENIPECEGECGHYDDDVLDENDNYCEIDPEVELSKSWKSLPSWEKVHHIQHRDLDRDADDSDVDVAEDEEQADGVPFVKSEIVLSHVPTIIEEEDRLASATNDTPQCVTTSTVVDDGIVTTSAVVTDSMHTTTTTAYNMVEDILIIDDSPSDVPVETSVQNEECSETTTENLPAQGETCAKPEQPNDDVQQITSLRQNEMMKGDYSNSKHETCDHGNIALGSQKDSKVDSHQKSPEKPDNSGTVCVTYEPEVLLDMADKYGEISQVKDINEGEDTDNQVIVTNVGETSIPSEVIIATCTAKSQNEIPATNLGNVNENVTLEGHLTNAADNVDKCILHGEDNITFLSNCNKILTSVAPIEVSNTEDKSEVSDEEVIVAEKSEVSDDEVIVAAKSEVSDEEVIVAACAISVNEEPGVILASPISDNDKDPFSSQSYCITRSVEVLPSKVSETTFSLNCPPLQSSPVKVTYVEDKNAEITLLEQGTDVDCVSDVDEINIDDNEVLEEGYKKSKSVTDLDEALASYGTVDSQFATGTMLDDTSSVSRSVPDIVDSCLQEDLKVCPSKTSDVTLDEMLPDVSVQNRHLSVSSPDFTEHPTSEKVKKITKIKIVNVKFLEVQDGSGAEDVEEDSFIIEGERPMSGIMKRRSGNFSPELSPVTSPTTTFATGTGEQQLSVPGKTEIKQLELGFSELYHDLPPSPLSTPSVDTQAEPTNAGPERYSTVPKLEEGKHVARYGVIQSQSPKPKDCPGMNLSNTFQMDSNIKRKPGSQSEKPNTQVELTGNRQREGPTRHKVSNSRVSRSKPKSSGRLVTVKTGVINDYYECSSDADSEMSYSAADSSPVRVRTRRTYHSATRDYPDSPSSSEPDSPRMRPADGRTSMTRVLGEGSRMNEPALFSRFGVAEQPNERSFSPQLEGGIMPGEIRPVFDNLSRASNRSVEFNPFANVEGYDGFEPYERGHSPTSSVSSDQSSVFSFNCDFDPLPPPSSTFNPDVYTCENPMCRRQDILLGPEKTSYKSCPACFTYYCSSQCRKLHWPAHKQSCYFGRVNTYVRSIIRLCQRRQDLSMYLSQLARDGYQKKGRGVVMATFSSPELAREFITKGHDAFSGRKPTFSSLNDLSREGIISKHRVALMQAIRDYEPNEEFVFNIAVVAVNDIPISPAPRYKLNTVLHCIKMPLNERIVARRPVEHNRVESRLFALPKCSRHEFVNEMEARRHYCRNLSKNLRQYNIRLKEDYPECYKKLCMYVEHDISFEPMVVYGQRNGLTYKCIVAPEQNYTFDPTYC